jgi:phosphatidylglycerophosphate synthase
MPAQSPTRIGLVVPYALSLVRLPLAILFFYVSYNRWLAILVLAATGLSDWLDGYVARRQGLTSPQGSILDAAMDKIFVFIALLALLDKGHLAPYQVIFVLSRDIFTAIFTVVCYTWIRRRMEIKSRLLGKLVTNLQFATILAALVSDGVASFLAGVTLVVSLLSITDYVHAFVKSGK